MGTLLRRFLVIGALLFWQGGFTFYAAVVVPVARKVLQPPALQTPITRLVTYYLNLAGAAALVVLIWDLAAAPPGGLRRWRWLTWLGMAALQASLFWLHQRLDAMLDPHTLAVADPRAFYADHRVYLWVSMGVWGLAAVWLGLSLREWRAADRVATS